MKYKFSINVLIYIIVNYRRKKYRSWTYLIKDQRYDMLSVERLRSKYYFPWIYSTIPRHMTHITDQFCTSHQHQFLFPVSLSPNVLLLFFFRKLKKSFCFSFSSCLSHLV